MQVFFGRQNKNKISLLDVPVRDVTNEKFKDEPYILITVSLIGWRYYRYLSPGRIFVHEKKKS